MGGAVGGSRPLRELFAAAGLRFGLDAAIFRELIPPALEQCLRAVGAKG